MAIEQTMVLYDIAREGFLDGTLDFDADEIRLIAVKGGYIPSASTHQYVNDVTPSEIVATSGALSGKLTADGIAKAANVTLSSVAAGSTIRGFIVADLTVDVVNGGRLLCYIGEDDQGNPISYETDGGDILIRFGAGTSKIFRI